MPEGIELIGLLATRCFCVVQNQKGVADAMIEAQFSYTVRGRLRCGTYTQHLTHDAYAARGLNLPLLCVAPARLPRHAVLPNAWSFSRFSQRLLRHEAHPERRQGPGQVPFPV